MHELVILAVTSRALKLKILTQAHRARLRAIGVCSRVDLVVKKRGEWTACHYGEVASCVELCLGCQNGYGACGSSEVWAVI